MAESKNGNPPQAPQESWDEYLSRIQIFDRKDIVDRFCGFVDILGFGAATQQNLPEVLELYERLLDQVDFLSGLVPGVEISVYSDSFVFVSDDLGKVLATASLLQASLLQRDYLVRGGIAHGQHAVGEKANIKFIVSAGVARAVAVEKSVKWPCVALHPEIEIPDSWWLSEARPVLFFDGVRIASPFIPFWFSSAHTRVSYMLERYPEHAEKYNWFLRLHKAFKEEPLVPSEVLERVRVTRLPAERV